MNDNNIDYAALKAYNVNTMESILLGEIDRGCKQNHFDNSASALGWAGIDSPYKEHAILVASWISSCWSYHFEEIKKEILVSIDEYKRNIPKPPEPK